MSIAISGSDEFVDFFKATCKKAEDAERVWVEGLRAMRVRAAHPDDGWVDKAAGEFQLVYPQYCDGVNVGDKVALGSPRATRIVTVTGLRRGIFDQVYYRFEATT